MINPLNYIAEFQDYIKAPDNCTYGMLCILNEEATEKAISAYKEYIELCSKVILSWDEIIIEDWEIKGFANSSDLHQQEQIEIAKELIDKGVINRQIPHPIR